MAKKQISAMLGTILILTSSTASAQGADPRSFVRRYHEGAQPVPASIDDVRWLEGYWIGKMPEGPVEQYYLAPAADQMPSFVRSLNDKGIVFYEISTFVARGGTIFIRLRHFTPDQIGWEDRSGPIERPLLAIEGGNLFFDRISFIRTGPDNYTVYFLNMEGDQERDTLTIPFRRIRR
jgi:hypothetical protein